MAQTCSSLRSAAVTAVLFLLSSMPTYHAFVPHARSRASLGHRKIVRESPTSSILITPASCTPNDSSTATTSQARSTSSCTPEEISVAQSQAEHHARTIHDNFAMNALFVNVPERPQPTPCRIAPNSATTTSLPNDLPPGCLLRIGPNGAPPDMGFLDGDGMVHCITLPPPSRERGDDDDDNNGNMQQQQQEIMYSATYVQAKGRKLERARRMRTGTMSSNGNNNDVTFSGTLGAAPQGLPMLSSLLRNGLTFATLQVQKDTCNTALAVSGSRVLALMEQSPPSQIEFTKRGKMSTVESSCRLDGAVPDAPINGGSLGAHGRTDPASGERVHVSYNSVARPYVRVDTFRDDWKLKSTVGVDVPAPVMVHDCALTENYVVILDFPLTIRPRRFLANLFPVEYEPENGARIGLLPRRGGEDTGNKDQTVWLDVENGVVLHAANAFERDDGNVVVHAFKSVPGGASSYILDYTPAFLYEWVLDPKAGKVVKERCLNPNVMVEFPAVEDRLTGREAAYAYGLVSTSIGGPMLQFKTPQVGVLLDSVVKLALQDDAEAGLEAGNIANRFNLPRGWHFVSEPTVVTKTGGDGHYILLVATYVPPEDTSGSCGDYDHIKVATDGQSMKSQFLVLDGESISDGPVTTVDLPYHMNYGLHSMFLEWDKMM